MKLTDKAVAALTLRKGERERTESDDSTTGLYIRLRAGANGASRRWLFRYSRGGRAFKFSFDWPAFNLAAARRQVGELQAKRRLGLDPAEDRRGGQALAFQTMAAVLPGYLAHKAALVRPRSFAELKRHLSTHYAPLHRHPLGAITMPMVAAASAAIAKEAGSTTAKNSWRSLHAFLAWALRQGLVDRNVAVGVEHPADRKRDRLLTASEIRLLWQATAGAGDYDAIVRLLLLTGCRASEIGSLRWSETYTDRIVIAAERVKNHRAHTLPLTPAVRAILEQRPRSSTDDFVFGREPGSGFSGWSKAKAELDKRLPLKPWVVHDLRRTFATGACELGISPHVIEAAVNHVSGFRSGVAGVYNRAALEGPIRHALGVWETHVMEIVEGRVRGDRVVPLRA